VSAITVVVSCSSSAEQVSAFLRHLASLGEAGATHLVLTTLPGLPALQPPEGFRSVQRLGIDPGVGSEHVRARAVRDARTEVVAFVEDHVRFAGPWVERAVRTLADGSAAALGWTVLAGGAGELLRMAGWLVEYSPWGPGREAGPADHLAGHNCIYRRDALLALGAELPSLLRAESVLHWHLRRTGRTLLFSRELVMAHYSPPTVPLQLLTDFWYGWNFGDARARDEGWTRRTRLLRAASAPAVPAVRALRLLRAAGANGVRRRVLLRCAPVAALKLVAGAMGEAAGALLGERGSSARLTRLDTAPRNLQDAR
jgi:hypothetical protein